MKKLLHLETRARNEIKLDQDLILLTIFSTILAVYGIKLNNTPILISSMLVSPLFDPIISSVVFILTQNIKGFFRSIRSLLLIFVISLITSLVLWFILQKFNLLDNFVYEMSVIPICDQIIIALVTGVVGSLLWVWPKTSNTSAGVAIAIALVPPLTNFTRGLLLGNSIDALSHLSLFIVNVVCIYLSAFATLWIYSRRKD